jgi:iron complex outermembrane recepter protein
MRNLTTSLFLGCAICATPVLAADETTNAAAADADSEIIVIGRGETRQVQELKTKDLQILAAGTSPLKAIEKLPSVNFQSADPFGTYEWSSRVSIRGFNQNQLGYTLDGIPLGDSSYGNNNGLHIGRAIIADNIGITRVSQGAGSLGTQATNNLGGTLEFISLDPKADGLAVDGNVTYGSSNTMRGFARVGFGQSGGARGFISGVYHKADKWKGAGEQRNWMVNGKLLVPIGEAEIDAYFSYSDRAEQDYQDLSLEQIARLGYDHDNFFPDYAAAVSAARNVFTAPINNRDDSYYDASGLRKDALASYGITAPLAENVTFKIKAYYHSNIGQGTWGTPYVPSPNGVPLSLRTTEYDIQRGGVFGSLNGQSGIHDITIGGWYEHNDFTQARRFYAYQSLTTPGRDHLKFQSGQFFSQWLFNFNTDTLQYYVQDKIDLGALTVNLGWKGFEVANEANPIIKGSLSSGSIRARDWFQPHAGLAYKLSDKAELFGGFTQSTRAFVSSATSGPFSTTQVGFDALKARGLKPESSDTYELGARYNDPTFNGTVGVYYVNFRNRLLGVPTGPGIVGSPAILQNVGGVRSIGFEAAGDVRLGGGLGLFASYSYTDATYRDDVTIPAAVVGGTPTVIAIKGKTVVDTPKHLLRGEVNYDNGSLFGRIAANYMSKRFFTYTNGLLVASDGLGVVPERVLIDAALGYRFEAGLRTPIDLQLNVTNLLDKNYISTIGSNGFGNIGDNQTFLAGSPQQFFATIKFGF